MNPCLLADATPPATTWIGVVDGYLAVILAPAVLIVLIVCVAAGCSWAYWLDNRKHVACERAKEQAVRRRLMVECCGWCPKCGTTTELRRKDGSR